MDLRDPLALDRVRHLFKQAAFVTDVGIELRDLGPGWVESGLVVAPRHGQAEQFIHGGVQATMADHTAGAAAGTLAAAEEVVVTVEYKINFLKPARGTHLRCRAEFLRPGRTLIVVEAKVYTDNQTSNPVAAAMVTLAVIPDPTKRA